MTRSILQGVVKDHRLPGDYRMDMVQPTNTKRFMKDFKRSMATRLMTKQYAAVPMFMFFGVAVPYFTVQSYIRMK